MEKDEAVKSNSNQSESIDRNRTAKYPTAYVCPFCGHKQDHGGVCDECHCEEFGLF